MNPLHTSQLGRLEQAALAVNGLGRVATGMAVEIDTEKAPPTGSTVKSTAR